MRIWHFNRVLSLCLIFSVIFSHFNWCYAETGGDVFAIYVDTSKVKGPMTPVWAWFGYDEPNYTYMKDGKKLLTELTELSPVPVYVRAHNLMCTGDGTAALKWGSTNVYTEDEDGNPVYDWIIIDKIFDTYVERGMKPLVEIGFMPKALSTRPEPYQHKWRPGAPYEDIFTGWAYPPKDYEKWAELVYQWVWHCVRHYGKAEAASWYWELWNEPNIGYWRGTTEEYCKLYDYTVDGVRRALPEAKVGGPHSTGPGWDKAAQFLHQFLRHCAEGTNAVTGETSTPLDFIAFHAKGSPRIVDGHIRMNMGTQLRDISKGFEIIASFEPYKGLPVIIGESDPEGCAACSMQDYPENAYRNGTMYSSYTAASFARKYELADHFGVNFIGAVSWSFEFENQPWFNGYRDLATNGVDKPVLNIFRMFGLMQGKRVQVSGDLAYDFLRVRDNSVRGEKNDINALAVADKNKVSVMVWNYHDDDLEGPDANVEITICSIPVKRALLKHYRVDKNYSNSYEVWKKMGSPQNPTKEQIRTLEEAGQLKMLASPEWVNINNQKAVIPIVLPRQGVSLLQLEW